MRDRSIKYVAIFAIIGTVMGTIATGMYYPKNTFLVFITTWLLLIPMAAIIYLIYGLQKYMIDRKNKIVVSIKSGSAVSKLMSIIRQEERLKKEKEILYKEIRKDNGINNHKE